MSQAGIVDIVAGMLPPDVPLSFKTDYGTDFDYNAGTGTAIPAANQIKIFGDNGIETVVNTTDTDVIQLRLSRGYTSTINVQTSTVLTVDTPDDTVETMHVLVNGLADNNDAIGGWVLATVKNIGGVASLVNLNDFVIDYEATLAGAVIELDVLGSTMIVQVTGVAGRTIQWGAVAPGRINTPE